MTAPAPEAEPQHGLHATELVALNGMLHCTVCDKDVCALAPEWLEHDTDVEDQEPEPPGPDVELEQDEPGEMVERLRPQP